MENPHDKKGHKTTCTCPHIVEHIHRYTSTWFDRHHRPTSPVDDISCPTCGIIRESAFGLCNHAYMTLWFLLILNMWPGTSSSIWRPCNMLWQQQNLPITQWCHSFVMPVDYRFPVVVWVTRTIDTFRHLSNDYVNLQFRHCSYFHYLP